MIAGAHGVRVDAGAELFRVGAERYQTHHLGQGIESQLAQHLLRLLARPLAVGDDGDRGTEQRLRGLAREARMVDRVQLLEQIAAVDEHAVLRADTLVRSEEHTSELQSPCNLVCRLLLEKKKKKREKSDPVRVADTAIPPCSSAT